MSHDPMTRATASRARLAMACAVGTLVLTAAVAVAHDEGGCLYHGVRKHSDAPCGGDWAPASVRAVNRHGLVVGSRADCNATRDYPVVWEAPDGEPTTIALPWPNIDASCVDVTDEGLIVGVLLMAPPNLPFQRGWTLDWNTGEFTMMGLPPGALECSPVAANGEGSIIVRAASPGGHWPELWDGKAYIRLTQLEEASSSSVGLRDLNDRGTVLAQIVVPNPADPEGLPLARGAVLRNGEVTILPPLHGDRQAFPIAINERDEVLVRSQVYGSTDRAYVWMPPAAGEQHGSIRLLDADRRTARWPADSSSAWFDLNDYGEVVGSGRCGPGVGNDTLWTEDEAYCVALLLDNPEDFDEPDPFGLRGVANDGSLMAYSGGDMIHCRRLPRRTDGDIDGDCTIGGLDLGRLLSNWGTDEPRCDLDDDGTVGVGDVLILISNWGGG